MIICGRILTPRALGCGGGHLRGLGFTRSRNNGTDSGRLSLCLASSPDLFRRFLHLGGLHGNPVDPAPKDAVGILSVLNDERVLLRGGLTIFVQGKPHVHFRSI
jgi:hypothetical protein